MATQKVTVTLDKSLVEKIDKLSEKEDRSRSKMINILLAKSALTDTLFKIVAGK